MPSYSGTVTEAPAGGLRLDKYIAEYLKILSRSQIKARKAAVKVNGKAVKISRLLKTGDRLELSWEESPPAYLVPEDLPLDIVYEDSKVIVINKAQGMVVHPGAGNFTGTLANALLFRIMSRQGKGAFDSNIRPGIVHRLDKDTSGLIVCAFDEKSHAFLSGQFKNRRVIKTYAALVKGYPKEDRGRIETGILRDQKNRKLFTASSSKGKPSLTLFRLVKTWGNYSLLLLRPKTGRTHQLRVHLKALGNPILGDPLYGGEISPASFRRAALPGLTLMLHAKRLSIVLPGSTGLSTFRTAFPQRFREFIHERD
jgi:23S rRNA pseudouridine1911/1915/1917 synthase